MAAEATTEENQRQWVCLCVEVHGLAGCIIVAIRWGRSLGDSRSVLQCRGPKDALTAPVVLLAAAQAHGARAGRG